jgi:hypothetical protein
MSSPESSPTQEPPASSARAHDRPLEPTALVKCGSHRARGKMLAFVGKDRAQALYSLHRETGKGVYRIPAELASAAKQITGVSGFRDGPDLHPCWPASVV